MAKRLRKKNGAPESAKFSTPSLVVPAALGTLVGAWRTWLPRFLIIVAMTLWIYWPSLRGGFIWDDKWYIEINPALHDWNGLWKFWFQPGNWVEYYPIQETVLWLQWHLWGEHTLGYHLTNVFLHILNAMLLWRLFSKFGMRFAWLGGLIFAIHPAQVESVAAICELKNTLSLPCFLLSMMAWIDYEESKARNDYQNALALYLVAMLCKISMAPFAGIILLYAWWKRGRIAWSDVKACAPFLLIAVILSGLTVWAGEAYMKSNHAFSGGTPLTGALSRIDASGLDATVYFARCFLPVENLFIYPQWPLHPGSLIEYLPWFVLPGVFSILWVKRRSWGRHVLLGLGFFLAFLAPFLGFLAVSYMNFIWVADHLLYIPIIGLIGLVVAGLGDLYAKIPNPARGIEVGIIACLIALMAWVSHGFAKAFVSEETFFAPIIARNPVFWIGRDNYANYLMENERYPEAKAQLEEAIRLRPDTWYIYYHYGIDLVKMGRPAEAEVAFRKGLELNPGAPGIYFYLGDIKRQAGQVDEAIPILQQGLKVAPEDESLGATLAGMLQKSGRIPEAVEVYQQTVKYNPDIAQLQYDFGVALLQTGDFSGAVEHLQAALDLDPKIAAAHENLGAALAQLGHLPEAIEQFEAALRINSGLVAARTNLALALAQTGRVPEAIDQFKQVLQIDPDNAKAKDSLAKLQQYQMQNTPGAH